MSDLLVGIALGAVMSGPFWCALAMRHVRLMVERGQR